MINLGPRTCPQCGAPTVTVQTANGIRWMVNPKPVQFVPLIYGRARYVTDADVVLRGVPPEEGAEDVHTGWILHRDACRIERKYGRK